MDFNKCKFIYHLWIDFNSYYIQYIVVNKMYIKYTYKYIYAKLQIKIAFYFFF